MLYGIFLCWRFFDYIESNQLGVVVISDILEGTRGVVKREGNETE